MSVSLLKSPETTKMAFSNWALYCSTLLCCIPECRMVYPEPWLVHINPWLTTSLFKYWKFSLSWPYTIRLKQSAPKAPTGLTRRRRQTDILGCPERKGDVTVLESVESWRSEWLCWWNRPILYLLWAATWQKAPLFPQRACIDRDRDFAERIHLKKQVKSMLGGYCSTWQEPSRPSRISCKNGSRKRLCRQKQSSVQLKVVFTWE